MLDNFKLKKNIFRGASTTYYYSSLFFTPEVKEMVFTLYAYVRYADDLIDCDVPKIKEFNELKKLTQEALNGKIVNDPIIDDFAKLSRAKKFEDEWIWAFLQAMESDLIVKKYATYADLKKYTYGSAQVIGLFMSKIFDTPQEAFTYAQSQGEAMQFINFVRDIKEDYELGRQYIPEEDLQKFDTKIPPDPGQNENFIKMIRFEINRYKMIQKRADMGLKFIPRRFRIMVKTSAAMYNWTAKQIEKDPLIVFRKKVKPSKFFVLCILIWNALTC